MDPTLPAAAFPEDERQSCFMVQAHRLWALRRWDVVEVLAYGAHRVTKHIRRDGAAELAAAEARRAEMHTAKDASVGHFFDGMIKADE